MWYQYKGRVRWLTCKVGAETPILGRDWSRFQSGGAIVGAGPPHSFLQTP